MYTDYYSANRYIYLVYTQNHFNIVLFIKLIHSLDILLMYAYVCSLYELITHKSHNLSRYLIFSNVLNPATYTSRYYTFRC